MSRKSRFGWRSNPLWSGQDWVMHQKVEKHLRHIVKLLPADFNVTVPYMPIKPFEAESLAAKSEYFYLDYAMTLNDVFIVVMGAVADYTIKADEDTGAFLGTIVINQKGMTIASHPFPSLVATQYWILDQTLTALRQRGCCSERPSG